MSKKKILILATIVIALIAVVSTTAHAAEGKWVKLEPGVEMYVPDNNEPDMELWSEASTITFYTGSAEENGGYAGIDCKGRPLQANLTAACRSKDLPLGTWIYVDGIGEYSGKYQIRDRGSGKGMGDKWIDIYVDMSRRQALRIPYQCKKAKVYIIRENE